jgi:nucleotide-binding universal stress UspA family protein
MPTRNRLPPHILSATDFSAQSERAFFHALALTVTRQAHLTLLHIGPESRNQVPWERYPNVRDTLVAWNQLAADASRTDVLTQLGLDVKKKAMRDEDPYNGMLDYLGKRPTDLLVMATAGQDDNSLVRRESIAESVAQTSRRRTLLLPQTAANLVDSATGKGLLRKALFVYDHEPDPRASLPWLNEWLPPLGPEPIELHMLYVGEDSETPELVLPGKSTMRWSRVTEYGPHLATILGYIERFTPDLVIMMNQPKTGLVARFRGSLSSQVLRKAQLPMLLMTEH